LSFLPDCDVFPSESTLYIMCFGATVEAAEYCLYMLEKVELSLTLQKKKKKKWTGTISNRLKHLHDI